MVDISKICCYTCNDLGHFATEYKKPNQTWKGKESYHKLKQKYEALLKKDQGRAYLDEGKSWDDSDEEGEFGNLALMAAMLSQHLRNLRYHFLLAPQCLIKIIKGELKN